MGTAYPNLTVLKSAKKYCLAVQDCFIARSTCSAAILDLTDPVRSSSTASLTSSTEKVEHHRSYQEASQAPSFRRTTLAYSQHPSESQCAHTHFANHLAGPVPATSQLSCHSESAQSVCSDVTTTLRAFWPKRLPTTPLRSAGPAMSTNPGEP